MHRITAISCLGASRTPAVGARGWRRHAGVRKTCTTLALGKLHQRTDEVAELNHGLEARVADQVEELGRVGRLKRSLAPQLAELIVSQGDEKILESHRQEIVVVFCDLRGCTAFTETAEPEEVLEFLREYHGALGPLVAQFEGRRLPKVPVTRRGDTSRSAPSFPPATLRWTSADHRWVSPGSRLWSTVATTKSPPSAPLLAPASDLEVCARLSLPRRRSGAQVPCQPHDFSVACRRQHSRAGICFRPAVVPEGRAL